MADHAFEMDDGNSLKSKNLAAFQRDFPSLHKKLSGYTPAARLVVGDDGEAEVVFNDNLFYNGRATEHAARQLEEFWKAPSRFFLVPPEPPQFDEHAIRFKNDILRRAVDEGIEFHERPLSSQSYFLVVFGVGLGHHIDELADKTDCQTLIVADANLEFLHHSLEVYDWSALFESFLESGRTIHFLFEELPENLWNALMFLVRTTNPCALDGLTFFVHYETPVISATLALMKKEVDLIVSSLGSLFDETLMVKNVHLNLSSGKSRVYFRPEERFLDVPVFVVASGPSLDKDLPFIKDNADRAVIVSCGSAIRPLLVNAVTPDFQIEVENIHVLPIISQVAGEFDISSVCLLTASTVEHGVEEHFDNILYYFRAALSPYPIFCDSERYCLKHPSPTVLNGGLSFAQETGFRDVYLFGADLGVRDAEVHHAKDTYHYTVDNPILDEQVCDMPIQANFGGKLYTSKDFYWTRNCLATAIKGHMRGRRYYNCSDGALIEGTQPQPSGTLNLPPIEGGKDGVVEKLIRDFPVYTKEKFEASWNGQMFVQEVDLFVDSLLAWLEGAPSLQGKAYLSKLARLLPQEIDAGTFAAKPLESGVKMLFRGTVFMMVIGLEYYLNRVADPDKARRFEEFAREEFTSRLEHLRRKAKGELGNLGEPAGKGGISAARFVSPEGIRGPGGD